MGIIGILILSTLLMTVMFFATITYLVINNRSLTKRLNSKQDRHVVFGPSTNCYGQNDPKRLMKEQRLKDIKHFFTFKWVWYWATKSEIKRRKRLKELYRKYDQQIPESRKRPELDNPCIRDGSHVVIKTKDKKLSKNFRTSGTKRR